jgi:plastocyanin
MRLFNWKTGPLWLCLVASAPALATNYRVTVGGTYDGGYGYDYPSLTFSPRQLTIQVGDTVTFANDGGTHNVSADNGSFRCAQGCDGQGGNGNPSSANWSATVTFNTPGTFGYHCEVHSSMGMTGSITVQGAAPTTFNLNQHGLSGSWANAATDSQGIVMTVLPDFYSAGSGFLFGGWFTFDTTAAGGQRWYTIQTQVDSNEDSAPTPIYQTLGGAFDTGQATTTTAVGQATIHFDDCTHGSLAYNFTDGSGRTGTIPLTRLLANATCATAGSNPGGGVYLRSGAWADLGNSGQGLVLEFNAPQGVAFGAWYTFLANAGTTAGAPGQHWYTLQAAMPATFTTLENIGIYDSTGGVFDAHATTTTTQVGSATITYHSCTSATMTYTFTAGPNAGVSGTLELTRIGTAPAGCSP